MQEGTKTGTGISDRVLGKTFFVPVAALDDRGAFVRYRSSSISWKTCAQYKAQQLKLEILPVRILWTTLNRLSDQDLY